MNNEQQLIEAANQLEAIKAEVEAMATGQIEYTVDIAAQTSKRLNAANSWVNRLS